MGIEQSVSFTNNAPPSWVALKGFVDQHGYPIQLRMIDGELAFLDEVPTDAWRELRVATPAGMVTLRRDSDRLVLVTWGNADAALLQAWNGLIWAAAAFADGRIE